MKIVIVGSGLLGMTTAYFLAKYQHEVTVVERRPGVAMETSFANATLLTPSLSAPWISAAQLKGVIKSLFSRQPILRSNARSLPGLIKWGIRTLPYLGADKFKRNLLANLNMCRYNLEVLQQLQIEIEQFDYDQSSKGNLMVFRQEGTMQHMQQEEQLLAEAGIANQVLDIDAIVKMEPALNSVAAELIGGIYHPGDSHGDPHKFCKVLEQQCQSLDVTFMFDTKVKRLNSKNGRIESVETDAGHINADAYVLAAGSFSEGLAAGLTVPVYPVKGYSITLNMDDSIPKPMMPLLDGDEHIALVPLGKRLRVTGFAELAGFDNTIYKDRIEILKQQVERTYPELSPQLLSGDLNPWSGFRPLSCDGVPLVGATKLQNVYLNTGHGTLGWSMAAASGKALADMIAGTTPAIDLSAYSPRRFM